MPVDVSHIAAALRGVAAQIPEGVSIGPFKLIMAVGRTTFTIRADGTANALAARALRLERNARRNYLTKGDARTVPMQSTFKQAKYSAAVAQRFVDDGEIDNFHAYCELTGHPHPEGGAYR